jgi:glycosyltransferase involved in cell wall biosynthesis
MLLSPYTKDISLYRSFFVDILEGAQEVICSTDDQARRFTNFSPENTIKRKPYEAPSSLNHNYKHDPASRNIVIIGAISEEKGANRLYQVASHCMQLNPSVHFYLIGSASNLQELSDLSNLTPIGSYSSLNDLHNSMIKIYSPIAFFPAIWPETWSYTLSEALLMGVPVIAPKLGAFGERLGGVHKSLHRLYDPSISNQELAELVCEGIG